MIDRVQVWNNTQSMFKKLPNKISTKYSEFNNIKLENKYNQTKVLVVDGDMIDYAIDIKLKGFNPLLLNMADEKKPGGKVDVGSGAQEEETFRRSDYHKFLDIAMYPLNNIECIYSKGVKYFKSGSNHEYNLLDQMIEFDMIAMPAIRFPQITPYNTFANLSDRELTKNKIRMIFNVAIENNNNVLVLSALGCGAFGNPPKEVAQLFKEVIAEFPNSFKLIIFAILTHQGMLVENNYSIFEKELN
jgi:uncharacterized protein (TIGR02452 family)